MSQPSLHDTSASDFRNDPPILRDIRTSPASDISVDALAIPDYDQLTPVQIASRLTGLPLDALQRIEDYEGRHRRRASVIAGVRAARNLRVHGHSLASF